MRRGSTPTFVFSLPADAACFTEIEILFMQDTREVLRVSRPSLTLKGKEVSFVMTEEQSLAFAPSRIAEIQIRLATPDGMVLISEIRTLPIRKKYPEDAI